MIEHGHLGTQPRTHLLQRLAGSKRRMKVAALRSRQQLDAQNAHQVFRHRQQTARPMRSHRHVVFLVGRGRDGVDRSRIGPLLVLGGQRCGGHLSDHEAGVEAGIAGEEGRQAAHHRIDQQRDPALGKIADLAGGHRQHVGGEGDRLGVEIAAGQSFFFIRKDQRVVGHAIGFGAECARSLTQHVERGAHHLRLTAQAIGILHALIIGEMRGADRRASHERAQRLRGLDLAAVLAQPMDTRIERSVRAARRVGRQRASDQRRSEQVFRLE